VTIFTRSGKQIVQRKERRGLARSERPGELPCRAHRRPAKGDKSCQTAWVADEKRRTASQKRRTAGDEFADRPG